MRIDEASSFEHRAVRAQRAQSRAQRSRSLAAAVGVAALLALTLLVWQLGLFSGSRKAPVIDANAPAVTAQPSAHATELTGVDDKNLPYSIKASKALQNQSAQKTVDLENVAGSFAKTETESLDVKSARAQYETDTKLLNLEGEVVIKSSADITATMEKAAVDVATRRLESRSPVKVIMPDGEVTADHLVVDNNGEKIKFTGRVKAVLGGDKE